MLYEAKRWVDGAASGREMVNPKAALRVNIETKMMRRKMIVPRQDLDLFRILHPPLICCNILLRIDMEMHFNLLLYHHHHLLLHQLLLHHHLTVIIKIFCK